MREYIKHVSEIILNQEDDNLFLLRWFISNTYQSTKKKRFTQDNPPISWEKSMQNAYKKLISEDIFKLTTDKAMEKIHNYALEKALKKLNRTEYSILLYIIAKITVKSEKDGTYYFNLENKLGKIIDTNYYNLLPNTLITFYPEGTIDLETDEEEKVDEEIINEQISVYQDSIDAYFANLGFTESLILILYYWIADLSIMKQYNSIVEKAVGNTRDYDFFQIDWNPFYEFVNKNYPTSYSYIFISGSKKTLKNMDSTIAYSISKLPEYTLELLPSIMTLLMNSLKPSRYKKSPKELSPSFLFEKTCVAKQKPDIEFKENSKDSYLPSIVSFLKVPVMLRDSSNTHYNINELFEDYELKLFQKTIKAISNADYYDRLRYMDENGISEQIYNNFEEKFNEFAKTNTQIINRDNFPQLADYCKPYIYELIDNSGFNFNLDYFDIFVDISKNINKISPKNTKKVNYPLSLLHLNLYTKWIDALLLQNGMPFNLKNYDNLLLKMLSLYPAFKRIVYSIMIPEMIEFFTNESDASTIEYRTYEYYEDYDPDHLHHPVLTLTDILGSLQSNAEEHNPEKLYSIFYEHAILKLNTQELCKALKRPTLNISKTQCFHNRIYRWIKQIEYPDLTKLLYEIELSDQSDIVVPYQC